MTLELLDRGAQPSARPSRPSRWGADAASLAGRSASTARPSVYDVGDLGDSLPGVPVAAAMAALIEAGNAPDAILFPASYDGRDVAGRLSAKLDRPGDHERRRPLDERRRRCPASTPSSAGRRSPRRASPVTARASSSSGPSRSRPSRPAAARRRSSRSPVPDAGADRRGQGRRAPRRGAPRPEARRGGGRRLGWPRSGRGRELRPDRGAGQAAGRRGRRLPCDRRRRLGALLPPGRPDRQDRQADGLHRLRHLGRHPAHGRDEEAKNIIAINKDQEAPIFSIADLGIVGDVHRCCPS